MKQFYLLFVFFIFSSCIPLRIAPTIKEDKVMVGKKFKRNLPRDYTFIFEDPKDASEFYHFINTKYQRNHNDVEFNVPFYIDDEVFFLSFYEIEIPTKTINLLPIVFDAVLDDHGYSPLFENVEFTRIGNWYLALLVTDNDMKDCLKPNHPSQEKVVQFLRDTRVEYLTTHDYIHAYLRRK
jgi:hypothetical protein